MSAPLCIANAVSALHPVAHRYQMPLARLPPRCSCHPEMRVAGFYVRNRQLDVFDNALHWCRVHCILEVLPLLCCSFKRHGLTCSWYSGMLAFSEARQAGLMTWNSLLFQQAAQAGLSHAAVLRHLVSLAAQRAGREPLPALPPEDIWATVTPPLQYSVTKVLHGRG